MQRLSSAIRAAVAGLLAGAMAVQVGSCTTQDVKAQFSRGLSTALNGLFNIASTDLSNEIFDVDD